MRMLMPSVVKHLRRHALMLGAGAFIVPAAAAQTGGVPAPALPPLAMSLADLRGFRPAGSSWRIAGGATADRGRAFVLESESGTGVLVNVAAAGASGPIATTWEHGDLWLAFDVMLARGSNAGVYLMGRYEVQLADSWEVRAPTHADIGGISQRWDTARGAGREGVDGMAPRQNASRAPGLWQHVEILFRAPKFDGTRKIANARFDRVTVNGVVVQELAEVTGPTRSAAFGDEQRLGPLMFGGDHGPLALRNIQYRSFAGPVTLTSLHFRAYEGDPIDSAFATTRSPVREGDATMISAEHVNVQDKFGVAYSGVLNIPVAGRYRFQFTLPWIPTDSAPRGPTVGGGRIMIDGAPVLVHAGAERGATADVEMAAGTHSFALSFYKNRAASNRRDVTLWLEGPRVERQALHESGGAPGFGPPINPIIVDAAREPVIVRSFLQHRNEKRVVAVSVADPAGVHFSYDLARGALLYAWRGPFLETTQMWHERGEDQLAQPLGSVLTLPGTVSLAFLADANAVWPDSLGETEFRRDGYSLDTGGRPTFLYRIRGIAVEDAVRPDTSGRSLVRDLHLRAASTGAGAGLYVQLAAASTITRERDGSYAVGDRSFYIALPRDVPQPIVRRQGDHDELVTPVQFSRGEARIMYALIW